MQSDPPEGPVPTTWITGCAAAHNRLHSIVAGLTDDIARRDTLLPGWTVGHLLTHLARNADSHRGMLESAQRGEISSQYPGGPAQRNGDIERGATRSAAALRRDLEEADRRLEHGWATTSRDVWMTGLGMRRYGPTTLADLVFLRWREVEIHLVDLALPELGSPSWDGLDRTYMQVELQELSSQLAARVPASTTVVLAPGDRPSRAFGRGDHHVVLTAAPGSIIRWLMSRGGDPSWPALLPWE